MNLGGEGNTYSSQPRNLLAFYKTIGKKEILIKFQRKLKNMDFNVEKKEEFPISLQRNVALLFRIKGTLAGKDITISIAPAESNNYIRVLNSLTI